MQNSDQKQISIIDRLNLQKPVAARFRQVTRQSLQNLLDALSVNLPHPVEVEGTDEIISAKEIAESEAALQEYWAGRDRGITSAELKQRLFGGNLG